MRIKYEVVDCCGDHIKFVELDSDAFPTDHSKYLGWDEFEAECDAVKLAGFNPGAICDACYDNAFRAHFVEYVEVVEYDEVASGNDYPLPFTD